MLVKSDTRYRTFRFTAATTGVVKRGTAVTFTLESSQPRIAVAGAASFSVGFLDEDFDGSTAPTRGAAVCLHEPSTIGIAGGSIAGCARVNSGANGKLVAAAAGVYATFAAAGADNEMVEIFAVRGT